MHRTTKIKITDLNPQLVCVLCGGYYIDAATIIECLHSFCRTCIIRYLESSKYCPICDVMVHKTKPLENVKSDKTLQDLVYKLVPGLYKNEMKRRREYYAEHPTDELCKRQGPCEDRGDEDMDRIIYNEDEKISLSLELFSDCVPEEALNDKSGNNENPDKLKRKDVRYLQCPAAITIGHLKKFIRMKFELPPCYQIDIYHSDDPLKDTFTLMDIAYIYTWRRNGPLRLVYTVYEVRRRKRKQPETEPDVTIEKTKQPCLTSQESQTNVSVLSSTNGQTEPKEQRPEHKTVGQEPEQDHPLDLAKNSNKNKQTPDPHKLTNGDLHVRETNFFKQTEEAVSRDIKKAYSHKSSKDSSSQKPSKEHTKVRKEKSKMNGHSAHPLNYKLHNGKLNGKEMYKISKETKRLINEMPEYNKVTKVNGIHPCSNSVSEYEFVD